MAEHGDAGAALAALPHVAQAAGIDGYSICPEGVVAAELKAARRAGARLLCEGDAAYPPSLSDLSDAPPLIWAIGDTGLLARPVIAIVGARNASSLGTRMARKLAADLGAAGYVTVSGLARGVDTAVHAATLATGTIAVVAGGVDTIYPTENASLSDAIGKQGLRLSEMPMGMAPQARHFPARNRIVSGVARAVVVVEAAARSGSLITARTALDQGREVLAVPGHPFDGRAAGCNMLLRDGATLVRDAADVIEHLGPAPDRAATATVATDTPFAPPEPPEPPRRTFREASVLHSDILSRLTASPVAEDQLIRDLGAAAHVVTPALVALELEGRIERRAGGMLTRMS